MPIRAVMRNVVDRIDFLSRNQDTLMGVPTGFTMMDRLLGGLQKSDLIILAARPAMGKTSLALNIAQNAAKRYDARVAVFSLEMSNDQLVQRLLSMETGIDSHRLRLGHVHDDEWPILLEAANVLAGANIFVDDTPSASVNEIRTKCRRLYAEHGLDLVVIDYLQLMSGGLGGKGGDNRQQEISYISRSLKGLARELNVPVIALSQLSRAVEGRADKRPMLSDLRESGCVTGDTLVQMADDGRRVPIRELAGGTGHQVITLNTATWKLEPSTVTAAFCTGTKAVYRLTSRLGRTIQATANHQFLTIQGWKRLDHLAVGDSIALPRILTVDGEATLSPEEDVYWDKVESILYTGEEPVFDLTVPSNHNFVANDIVIHNSIEQDADVVLFIYREDYYIEDTDRQNIADIIIAKHRHGSTGTVSLFFRKELTQFRDLEIQRQDLDY
jgi:replicative DNA helicase